MMLFDEPVPIAPRLIPRDALSYYPTPGFVAHLIFEENIAPHLTSESVLIDPTAGDGALLRAIPSNVRAFGVEL